LETIGEHVADEVNQKSSVVLTKVWCPKRLDQIEAGQAVGDRLKKRQEELDIIKGKLDLADMPEVSRDTLAAMIAPYGPLIGLGMGDVATMRQILRKCGITSIVVTPEGPGAWRFEGQADFSGVLHRRSSAPPPDTPPGQGSDPPAPGRASAEAEEDLDKRGAA